MDTKIVGVKNNKAKSRRQAKHKKLGTYQKQAIRTEINRKRKQAKHLKMVEKKALKRVLFSL